jgi:hypothetical protein
MEMDVDAVTMLRAENAALRTKLALVEMKLDRAERVVIRFYTSIWCALRTLGLDSLFTGMRDQVDLLSACASTP